MSQRLAAVTGASSGIGSTFARRLAADGYNLLLIARRRDRLEALAAELTQAHRVQAEALVADLVDDADLHAVAGRLAASPDLELLVNNAGFGVAGRFFQTPLADQERMHRLHVMATLSLTHAALQVMVAADRGAIINVSSVAGFTASPGSVSYCATKHWMNNFTEGLHLDLVTKRSKVRVQALCPGFTYSEFHDVIGMDRKVIPQPWWTSAETVVNASLDGLAKGTLFVVPGWRYRLLVGAVRYVPGSLLRAGTIRWARRMKRSEPA